MSDECAALELQEEALEAFVRGRLTESAAEHAVRNNKALRLQQTTTKLKLAREPAGPIVT